VRHDSPSRVAAVLRPILSRHAFVSPETNGWVTVLDEGSELAESATELRRVGAALSVAVSAAALCIRLEDDDLFDVVAFENGAPTVDERVASHGDRSYVAPDPVRRSGAAATLARFAAKRPAVVELENLLDPDAARQFKEDRVLVLARLLGIDPRRASSSFVALAERGSGDPRATGEWMHVMSPTLEQRHREWSERKKGRRRTPPS
jgi:hypothetical protein